MLWGKDSESLWGIRIFFHFYFPTNTLKLSHIGCFVFAMFQLKAQKQCRKWSHYGDHQWHEHVGWKTLEGCSDEYEDLGYNDYDSILHGYSKFCVSVHMMWSWCALENWETMQSSFNEDKSSALQDTCKDLNESVSWCSANIHSETT